MSIDDFTEEPKKGLLAKIDNKIQQHYNRKVAQAEKNGISRFDLAENYLNSAKRWNFGNALNVPHIPFALISCYVGNNLCNITQKMIDKLRNEENQNTKNFSVEMWKSSLKSTRKGAPFFGTVLV